MPSRLLTWLKRRWLPVAVAMVVLLGIAVFVAVDLGREDWGSPVVRVASPTGEYEVVQYEFRAVIDPGWNLSIESADGDGREWFWRSVEGPAPDTIRFTGSTSIEVVDESGEVYEVQFDADSLEPTDRFCLRPEYCDQSPWDNYTRDGT